MYKHLFIIIISFVAFGCTVQQATPQTAPIVDADVVVVKIKKKPYFLDNVDGCKRVKGHYKSPECPSGVCEYVNYVCGEPCPL